MATEQEIEITRLEARLAQFAARISTLQGDASRIQNEIDRSIAREDYGLARSQSATLVRVNTELSDLITTQQQLEQQLQQAQAQQQSQEQAKQGATGGATSAGATVAASDDAGVVNPAKKTEALTPEGRITNLNPSGTNADPALTTNTAAGETVSESPDRKIGETQLPIKPPNTGEIKRLTNEPPADPLSPPPGTYGSGVGSAGDDATPTKNLTRQDIELNFNEDIRPQPNILDQYASYTYQISLYLLNETDYRRVVTRNRLEAGDTGILGGQLLVQSGGENQAVGIVESAAGTSVQPSRNPNFNLDYYIESMSLKNIFQGKGTGGANSYTDLKMTIVEPNGISFIDNLKQAVKDYCGITTFASAIYCLVIRWIGYDENGNIVYAGSTNSGGDKTDPYAIAIKYVPFVISTLGFSVGNRLTTYELSGTPIMHSFRLRQTTPYNFELSGKTVQEILGGSITAGAAVTEGRVNSNNATSRPTATNASSLREALNAAGTNSTPTTSGPGTPVSVNTAPAGTGNPGRGLMQAMNEAQQELVKKGIYEIADEFYLEFANPSIANATIKKEGSLSIDKTPMGSNDARSLLPDTSKVFGLYRNFGVTAGQSMLQVMEMVIRNSSYITDQQLKIIDEETQQEKPNGTAIETFAWFKISSKAEPNGFDRKRNDYAYKFTFVVSIYEVKSSNSVWFPRTRFRGVHKTYPYWFTGRNTAVLDYQQNFDNLYVTVISGAGDTIQGDFTSALTDIPRYVYQPRSGQSSQGADQATNEPAANAADYLYSPSDLGTVKVKIIGDPAWLQQGEIFRGNDPTTFNFSAFNPDGGINFDSQEVLFEIVWQRPVDYNITGDGLMDPNRYAQVDSSGVNSKSGSGLQSYVFYAIEVLHEFRQGRFEQTLSGGLYIFPRNKDTKINSGAASTGTGASGFPLSINPNSSGTGTGASGFPISVGQTSTSQKGKRVGTVKTQTKTGTGASGFPLTDSRVTLPVKPKNPGVDFATAYSLRNRPGGPPKVQTTTPGIPGNREP
jgi:hypothetical protein